MKSRRAGEWKAFEEVECIMGDERRQKREAKGHKLAHVLFSTQRSPTNDRARYGCQLHHRIHQEEEFTTNEIRPTHILSTALEAVLRLFSRLVLISEQCGGGDESR